MAIARRSAASTTVILVFGLAARLVAAEEHEPSDRGLRFDSPGVLDLAERSQQIAGSQAVPVAELAAADAERIFAAPAIGEDPPMLRFSDDEYGCEKASRACSQEHERKLTSASGATVARDGKRLTVTPTDGQPAVFIDWKQPASKSTDGDEETHWYLGRLADGLSRPSMASEALGLLPGGYERVEVQFGHDAPGSFLVNPRSGKVAFVHNGADLVAPSPDGRLLLTWNSLNPPLSLRVAALDSDGPRLVVQCAAPEGKERLTPVFKGWRGAHGFDFVVEIGAQGKSMARLAASLRENGGRWELAASDGARLAATGLGCKSR
jgi:hypothetical protein